MSRLSSHFVLTDDVLKQKGWKKARVPPSWMDGLDIQPTEDDLEEVYVSSDRLSLLLNLWSEDIRVSKKTGGIVYDGPCHSVEDFDNLIGMITREEDECQTQ